MLPDDFGLKVSGKDTLQGGIQAADGSRHGPRVSMGPDDARIGVEFQQGFQAPQVVGRFERPTFGGSTVLQGLQGLFVLYVGGGHVACIDPASVARDVRLSLHAQGADIQHHEGNALFGKRGSERVHGPEGRVEFVKAVGLLFALGDAWIRAGIGQRRGRNRRSRFPLQKSA